MALHLSFVYLLKKRSSFILRSSLPFFFENRGFYPPDLAVHFPPHSPLPPLKSKNVRLSLSSFEEVDPTPYPLFPPRFPSTSILLEIHSLSRFGGSLFNIPHSSISLCFLKPTSHFLQHISAMVTFICSTLCLLPRLLHLQQPLSVT